MLKELVLNNRSFRGFDENRKISKDELLELIELARLCPSSVNMQPLKYKLLWEEKEVEELLKLTKWARGLPELNLPKEGMHPTAFIVICIDTNIAESIARFQKDVGIVAQTILLGAVEMGLGGCMIGNFGGNPVSEKLELSENLSPSLIIALGKPKEEIVLTEPKVDGNFAYYRDENGIHYVPKRRIEDVLIN